MLVHSSASRASSDSGRTDVELPLGLWDNADLDAAYEAAMQARDFAAAKQYADEIVSRLADPGSFLYGLIVGDEFPLYQARTGFDQSAASQSSIQERAAEVGTTITATAKTAAKAAGSVAWSALWPVAVAGGLFALAAFLMRRKGASRV